MTRARTAPSLNTSASRCGRTLGTYPHMVLFGVWSSSSCNLTPLRRKPKPRRNPAKTPARPIAVGEPTQRAFAAALTKAGTETYKEYLLLQQLAIGVSDAAGQLVHGFSAPYSSTHATTSSSCSTRRMRFRRSNGPFYWSACPRSHRARSANNVLARTPQRAADAFRGTPPRPPLR